MNKIAGHHHISMITKKGQETDDFYQKVLGLRRVKKTVNQEDTRMYHLFYGDLTGSAGTELSFFEMPMAGRTKRGTNSISRIGLLVSSYESLLYWKKRFASLGIKHGDITTYAGRDALHFEDSEGLQLVLLNNQEADVPDHWKAWNDSQIDLAHRILGMGAVELTVQSKEKLASVLTNLFGYEFALEQDNATVYQSFAGQAFGEIVVVEQDGPKEKPGKGSVHHLAIRVKDGDELRRWEQKIKEFGLNVMKITDRFYFESLYFREENGILFELATDGPGFTVDSSIENLGKDLDLPPFLEARRTEIEAHLDPIE